MCLAQGHKLVTPVRLEPTALLSRVKHSKTARHVLYVGKLIQDLLFEILLRIIHNVLLMRNKKLVINVLYYLLYNVSVTLNSLSLSVIMMLC